MTMPFDLPTLSGAERLYADLFSCKDLSEIPLDVEETMSVALDSLDEYYAQYVKHYYWDGMTYAEMAKPTNSNPETIKKIVKRGVLKLKDRAHLSYILHGDKYYRAERYKRLQDEIAFEEHEVAKLEKMLERLKEKRVELQESIRSKLEIESYEEFTEVLDSDNISISELNLSSRCCNALERVHLLTIGDLRKVCRDYRGGLYYVRNLGKKGVTEICEAVTQKTGIPLDMDPENPLKEKE